MASSDSQMDKLQRGCPKRAELPDVNINTGVQSINTERASLRPSTMSTFTRPKKFSLTWLSAQNLQVCFGFLSLESCHFFLYPASLSQLLCQTCVHGTIYMTNPQSTQIQSYIAAHNSIDKLIQCSSETCEHKNAFRTHSKLVQTCSAHTGERVSF